MNAGRLMHSDMIMEAFTYEGNRAHIRGMCSRVESKNRYKNRNQMDVLVILLGTLFNPETKRAEYSRGWAQIRSIHLQLHVHEQS